MKRAVLLALVFSLTIVGTASAMTSVNYTIDWDSVNSGGTDFSTSANYRLSDTLGEQGTGTSTSATYQIGAGYRQGIEETTVLSFDFGTQENATQTAYTAFSSALFTVTVAATSSFAVGQFIGVVENEGLFQVVAVGKITDISGDVITVDQWEGSPGLLSASPTGGDDVVYRLEGTTADFGTLTIAGASSMTHTSVTTNAQNGYTLYIHSDGDFRAPYSQVIDAVLDGSVTATFEEYGARVFGTRAVNTGSDFAITQTKFEIQESSTFAIDERIALIYKVSISGGTIGGTYSQIVYYTVTANF